MAIYEYFLLTLIYYAWIISIILFIASTYDRVKEREEKWERIRKRR